MFKSISFIRSVSVFVISCFLYSFVIFEPLYGAIELVKERNQVESLKNIKGQFFIPYNYGHITDGKLSDRDTLVIYVQDLHCNPEIQKNISNLLSLFKSCGNLNKIFVEGAPRGKVDLGLLKSIPDEGIKWKALNNLLNKGVLTGTEYFCLKSDHENLFGLENWGIYSDNLNRLQKLMALKEENKENIKETENLILEFKKKYLSKDTAKLLNKINNNGNNETRFLGLEKLGERVNETTTRYPNLYRYIQMIKISKNMRYSRLGNDLNKYVTNLKSIIPMQEYSELASKINDKKNLDEYCYTLCGIAKKYTPELSSKYPEVDKYLNYISLNYKINPICLMAEEKLFKERVLKKYVASTLDNNIVFMTGMINSLSDCVELKMNSEQHSYFSQNKQRFSVLLQKYFDYAEIKPVLDILASEDYEKYYKMNFERNQIFAESLFKEIKIDEKASTQTANQNPIGFGAVLAHINKFKEVNIVIAGGFHSDIVKDLQEKHLSFLTLTPSIQKKFDETMYEKVICGRVDIEKTISTALAPRLTALNLDPESLCLLLKEVFEAAAGADDVTFAKLTDWFNGHNPEFIVKKDIKGNKTVISIYHKDIVQSLFFSITHQKGDAEVSIEKGPYYNEIKTDETMPEIGFFEKHFPKISDLLSKLFARLFNISGRQSLGFNINNLINEVFKTSGISELLEKSADFTKVIMGTIPKFSKGNLEGSEEFGWGTNVIMETHKTDLAAIDEGVAGIATLKKVKKNYIMHVIQSFRELYPTEGQLKSAVQHELRELEAREGRNETFNAYMAEGLFKKKPDDRKIPGMIKKLPTQDFVTYYHAFVKDLAEGRAVIKDEKVLDSLVRSAMSLLNDDEKIDIIGKAGLSVSDLLSVYLKSDKKGQQAIIKVVYQKELEIIEIANEYVKSAVLNRQVNTYRITGLIAKQFPGVDIANRATITIAELIESIITVKAVVEVKKEKELININDGKRANRRKIIAIIANLPNMKTKEGKPRKIVEAIADRIMKQRKVRDFDSLNDLQERAKIPARVMKEFKGILDLEEREDVAAKPDSTPRKARQAPDKVQVAALTAKQDSVDINALGEQEIRDLLTSLPGVKRSQSLEAYEPSLNALVEKIIKQRDIKRFESLYDLDKRVEMSAIIFFELSTKLTLPEGKEFSETDSIMHKLMIGGMQSEIQNRPTDTAPTKKEKTVKAEPTPVLPQKNPEELKAEKTEFLGNEGIKPTSALLKMSLEELKAAVVRIRQYGLEVTEKRITVSAVSLEKDFSEAVLKTVGSLTSEKASAATKKQAINELKVKFILQSELFKKITENGKILGEYSSLIIPKPGNVKLTYYGGDEIGCGGIKIEVGTGDSMTTLVLDPGINMGRESEFFDIKYSRDKSAWGIDDRLLMGLMPRIKGLWRRDVTPDNMRLANTKPTVDGILITHAHVDHMGNAAFVDPRIPWYVSPELWASLRMLNDTGADIKKEFFMYQNRENGTMERRDIRVFEYDKPFKVGNLEVMATKVDHSETGACAFFVNTPEGWVAWTGDLRMNAGINPKTGIRFSLKGYTESFIEKAKAMKIKALFIEGTAYSPEHKENPTTEEDILHKADEVIKTAHGGPADFVLSEIDAKEFYEEFKKLDWHELIILNRVIEKYQIINQKHQIIKPMSAITNKELKDIFNEYISEKTQFGDLLNSAAFEKSRVEAKRKLAELFPLTLANSDKGGLVVANFDFKNVERMKNFLKAAKDNGRKLVISARAAYHLEMLKESHLRQYIKGKGFDKLQDIIIRGDVPARKLNPATTTDLQDGIFTGIVVQMQVIQGYILKDLLLQFSLDAPESAEELAKILGFPKDKISINGNTIPEDKIEKFIANDDPEAYRARLLFFNWMRKMAQEGRLGQFFEDSAKSHNNEVPLNKKFRDEIVASAERYSRDAAQLIKDAYEVIDETDIGRLNEEIQKFDVWTDYGVPDLYKEDGLLVYQPPKQKGEYEKSDYRRFEKIIYYDPKIEGKVIRREDAHKQRADIVLCLNTHEISEMLGIADPTENTYLISSQCTPFNLDMVLAEQAMMQWIELQGIPLSKGVPGEKAVAIITNIHASGHCLDRQLMQIVKDISPDNILAVHSFNREGMAGDFRSVVPDAQVSVPLYGKDNNMIEHDTEFQVLTPEIEAQLPANLKKYLKIFTKDELTGIFYDLSTLKTKEKIKEEVTERFRAAKKRARIFRRDAETYSTDPADIKDKVTELRHYYISELLRLRVQEILGVIPKEELAEKESELTRQMIEISVTSTSWEKFINELDDAIKTLEKADGMAPKNMAIAATARRQSRAILEAIENNRSAIMLSRPDAQSPLLFMMALKNAKRGTKINPRYAQLAGNIVFNNIKDFFEGLGIEAPPQLFGGSLDKAVKILSQEELFAQEDKEYARKNLNSILFSIGDKNTARSFMDIALEALSRVSPVSAPLSDAAAAAVSKAEAERTRIAEFLQVVENNKVSLLEQPVLVINPGLIGKMEDSKVLCGDIERLLSLGSRIVFSIDPENKNQENKENQENVLNFGINLIEYLKKVYPLGIPEYMLDNIVFIDRGKYRNIHYKYYEHNEVFPNNNIFIFDGKGASLEEQLMKFTEETFLEAKDTDLKKEKQDPLLLKLLREYNLDLSLASAYNLQALQAKIAAVKNFGRQVNMRNINKSEDLLKEGFYNEVHSLLVKNSGKEEDEKRLKELFTLQPVLFLAITGGGNLVANRKGFLPQNAGGITFYNRLDRISGNIIKLRDGDSNIFLDMGSATRNRDEFFTGWGSFKVADKVQKSAEVGTLPWLPEILRKDMFKSGIIPIESGDTKAVVLTHAHLDHIEALFALDPDVLVICSEETRAALETFEWLSSGVDSEYTLVRSRLNKKLRRYPQLPRKILTFKANQPLDIEGTPFKITPIRVGHSIPTDAFMIETSMGKIVYTGDLTIQSHDGADTKRFFDEMAKEPDILMLIHEGINVRAEQRGNIETEQDYYNEVDKIIKGIVKTEDGEEKIDPAMNMKHKPVFTSFPWMYVNRSITYYQLAKANGRKLVIPLRVLYFNLKLRELGYDVPDFFSDPDVLIHVPERKWSGKIVGFIRNLFGKLVSMTSSKVKVSEQSGKKIYGELPDERMVTSEWLSKSENAEQCIITLSLAQLNELNIIRPPTDSPFIYSAGVPFSDGIKQLNAKIKTWTGQFMMVWYDYYVSPHINEDFLIQNLDRIKAKYRTPIHTERSFRLNQLLPLIRHLLPKSLVEYPLSTNEGMQRLTDSELAWLEDEYKLKVQNMTDADFVTMLRDLPILKNERDFGSELAKIISDAKNRAVKIEPAYFLRLMSGYYMGQMLRLKFKEKYLLANSQELAGECQALLSGVLGAVLDYYKHTKKSLELDNYAVMLLGDFGGAGKNLNQSNLAFIKNDFEANNKKYNYNTAILGRLISEAMYEITGGTIGLNPKEPIWDNKLTFVRSRTNTPGSTGFLINQSIIRTVFFPNYAVAGNLEFVDRLAVILRKRNLIAQISSKPVLAPAPGVLKLIRTIFNNVKGKLSPESKALFLSTMRNSDAAAKLLTSLPVIKSRKTMRSELLKYIESSKDKTAGTDAVKKYYKAQILRLEVARLYHVQTGQDAATQKETLKDVCDSVLLEQELQALLSHENLPLPVLDVYERVYRYYALERLGLLLDAEGKPDKDKLTSTIKFSQEYLEKIKGNLPAGIYESLTKKLSTAEGVIEIAQQYPKEAGLEALGSYSISFDKERNAYVVKLNRAEAVSALGRLAQTEFTRLFYYHEISQRAKDRKIGEYPVIIEDDQNNARGEIRKLIESGKLGRLADNHAHMEALPGRDFFWSLVMGSIELPEKISPQFKEALYPELAGKTVTSIIDWNNKGKVDYVDNNELLINARNIRRKLVKDSGVPYTISDEELMNQALDSGKAAVLEDTKKYFALKHIMFNKTLCIPYEGEPNTVDNFLDQHDTYTTILKRRMSNKGEMNKQDFALITGLYVRQIIEEYKDNSFMEIRIQPKYDQEEMELAMKEAAKAVLEAKEKYPELTVNLVMVFRKKDTDEQLHNQVSWFLGALRKDSDLRECFGGWDAASYEGGNPPERFQFIANAVNEYNHSKEEYPRLETTYHVAQGDEAAVGGKGHDSITSMRYVDEAVEKIDAASLGHALGVMFPFTGLVNRGPQEVNRSELQKTFEWLEHLKLDEKVDIDIQSIQYRVEAKMPDYTTTEGDPLVHFNEPFLTEEETYKIARYVVKKIIEKKVFIEFNPTANVGNQYVQHPLFRLLMSDFVIGGESFEGLKELVTINSDTPGMESLNGVKDEFINIGATLLKSGMPLDEVTENLKVLAKNGRKRGMLFAFKGLFVDGGVRAILDIIDEELKDIKEASVNIAKEVTGETTPQAFIEEQVEEQWLDPDSPLNTAKNKVNKIIEDIVSPEYSLVVIASHHFNYPADTDSLVYSAAVYKRIVDEAEKPDETGKAKREYKVIFNPQDAKDDGKLYICIFPITDNAKGYTASDAEKLNLPEIKGKRALLLGDFNIGNVEPYKRNKSFGFDAIVTQDHHNWPKELVDKIGEYSDAQTLYLNTYALLNNEASDAYSSGALQAALMNVNGDSWYRMEEQLSLLGDGYYRRFPNLMKDASASIDDIRYISDTISLLSAYIAKFDSSKQIEILFSLMETMRTSANFKELKEKTDNAIKSEKALGPDFIEYRNKVMEDVEKSIEQFLASKEKVFFYKIEIPDPTGKLFVIMGKMANDRLNADQKKYGKRVIAHYQVTSEGNVRVAIARSDTNTGIDVSEPCRIGPKGNDGKPVAWGGGHLNRAGFTARVELLKDWWGADSNPQKVLDFVRENIEQQLKKIGTITWVSDIHNRPDLVEQQLSDTLSHAGKDPIVIFEQINGGRLDLYRQVADGEVSPSVDSADNGKAYITNKLDELAEDSEIFHPEAYFMHLKVLSAIHALGKKVTVEGAPENTDAILARYKRAYELQKEAEEAFSKGDVETAAEKEQLYMQEFAQACLERDIILETYIKELRQKYPNRHIVVVRGAMHFGIAKKMKEEGSTVALKWWKPRIRGFRMGQIDILISKYLIAHETGKTTERFRKDDAEDAKIKKELLLRSLAGSFLQPAYVSVREREVLYRTLSRITDRLNLTELNELAKYISNSLQGNEKVAEIDKNLEKAKAALEKAEETLKEMMKAGQTGRTLFDFLKIDTEMTPEMAKEQKKLEAAARKITREKNKIKELEAKKKAIITGYALLRLIDKGKIHKAEFKYFPRMNYFIPESSEETKGDYTEDTMDISKRPAPGELDQAVEEIKDAVKKSNPNASIQLIDAAYKMAKEQHLTQTKEDGEDFVVHPVRVAYLLMQLGVLDEKAIAAALLHDAIERQEGSKQEPLKHKISVEIGPEIARMLEFLTKYKSGLKGDKLYVERMMDLSAPTSVQLIKILEKLDKFRDFPKIEDEAFKKLYIKRTCDVYVPFIGSARISEDLNLSKKIKRKVLRELMVYPEVFAAILESDKISPELESSLTTDAYWKTITPDENKPDNIKVILKAVENLAGKTEGFTLKEFFKVFDELDFEKNFKNDHALTDAMAKKKLKQLADMGYIEIKVSGKTTKYVYKTKVTPTPKAVELAAKEPKQEKVGKEETADEDEGADEDEDADPTLRAADRMALTTQESYEKAKVRWAEFSIDKKKAVLKNIVNALNRNSQLSKLPVELQSAGKIGTLTEGQMDDPKLIALYAEIELAPKLEAGELMKLAFFSFTNRAEYKRALSAFKGKHTDWGNERESNLFKLEEKIKEKGIFGFLAGYILGIALNIFVSTTLNMDLGTFCFVGLALLIMFLSSYIGAYIAAVSVHKNININSEPGEVLTTTAAMPKDVEANALVPMGREAFITEFNRRYNDPKYGGVWGSLIGKNGDLTTFFDFLTGMFGRYGLGREERNKEGEIILDALLKLSREKQEKFLDEVVQYFKEYTYLASGTPRYLPVMLAILAQKTGRNVFDAGLLAEAQKEIDKLSPGDPNRKLLEDAVLYVKANNPLFTGEMASPETLLLPNTNSNKRYLDIGAGLKGLGLDLGQAVFPEDNIQWEGTDIFFPVFKLEENGDITHVGRQAVYDDNGVLLHNAIADPKADVGNPVFNLGKFSYISLCAILHHLKPEGINLKEIASLPIVNDKVLKEGDLEGYEIVLRGRDGVDQKFDRTYPMAPEQQEVIARALNSLEDRGVLFLNFSPFWALSQLWFGSSPENTAGFDEEQFLQIYGNGLTFWMIQRDDANKKFIIYNKVLSFDVAHADTLEWFIAGDRTKPQERQEKIQSLFPGVKNPQALIQKADKLVYAEQAVDQSRMKAIAVADKEIKLQQAGKNPVSLEAVLKAYLSDIPDTNPVKASILDEAKKAGQVQSPFTAVQAALVESLSPKKAVVRLVRKFNLLKPSWLSQNSSGLRDKTILRVEEDLTDEKDARLDLIADTIELGADVVALTFNNESKGELVGSVDVEVEGESVILDVREVFIKGIRVLALGLKEGEEGKIDMEILAGRLGTNKKRLIKILLAKGYESVLGDLKGKELLFAETKLNPWLVELDEEIGLECDRKRSGKGPEFISGLNNDTGEARKAHLKKMIEEYAGGIPEAAADETRKKGETGVSVGTDFGLRMSALNVRDIENVNSEDVGAVDKLGAVVNAIGSGWQITAIQFDDLLTVNPQGSMVINPKIKGIQSQAVTDELKKLEKKAKGIEIVIPLPRTKEDTRKTQEKAEEIVKRVLMLHKLGFSVRVDFGKDEADLEAFVVEKIRSANLNPRRRVFIGTEENRLANVNAIIAKTPGIIAIIPSMEIGLQDMKTRLNVYKGNFAMIDLPDEPLPLLGQTAGDPNSTYSLEAVLELLSKLKLEQKPETPEQMFAKGKHIANVSAKAFSKIGADAVRPLSEYLQGVMKVYYEQVESGAKGPEEIKKLLQPALDNMPAGLKAPLENIFSQIGDKSIPEETALYQFKAWGYLSGLLEESLYFDLPQRKDLDEKQLVKDGKLGVLKQILANFAVITAGADEAALKECQPALIKIGLKPGEVTEDRTKKRAEVLLELGIDTSGSMEELLDQVEARLLRRDTLPGSFAVLVEIYLDALYNNAAAGLKSYRDAADVSITAMEGFLSAG